MCEEEITSETRERKFNKRNPDLEGDYRSSSPKLKLNLGCGTKIKEGFVNLDKLKIKGVDIGHDLEKIPYPFRDGEVDYILAENILEHLNNYEGCINELKRILKPLGTLDILVPYSSLECSEFHRRFFRYNSFVAKRGGTSSERIRLYGGLKIIKRKIIFRKGFPFWYNYLFEFIFNLSPIISLIYEETLLRYLFPAYLIRFVLVKAKSSKEKGERIT